MNFRFPAERFFVDTNIFAYSFDQTAPAKATRATALLRHALDSGKGIISYQVVQEFVSVAIRKFPVPITLADLERYITVAMYPLLAVHSSRALYLEALRLVARYKLPWYDSLIVAAAVQGEALSLYSEDFQHGRSFGSIRVVNPFAES